MKIYYNGNKKVFTDINGFTIKTDQAKQSGGDGEFPEPFTLFLASLGTCTGIYVKVFCDQRSISTEKISLSQEQHFNSDKRIIDKIELSINIPEDFPAKYEAAMIQTASLCAVKKHLREDIDVTIKTLRS